MNMRIRTGFVALGMTLVALWATPAAASAAPDQDRTVAGAADSRATAPLPVPAVKKYLKLERPAVSTLAWECDGGYSCYFDGANGTSRFWVAPRGGEFFDLGSFSPPQNDKMTSVWNGGGGDVDLYDWRGYWAYVGTVGVGTYGNLRSDINNIVDGVLVN
jgi:hypothetical protein